MSWERLIQLIADEFGDDIASKIEDRARDELGGERLFVRKKKLSR